MGRLAVPSPSKEQSSSLARAGPWAPQHKSPWLCKEEQLGKQRSASLPPNGEANCYHLVGSVNTMGAWNANQGDSLTEDRGAAVWVVPGSFTSTIDQGQALTKPPMLV